MNWSMVVTKPKRFSLIFFEKKGIPLFTIKFARCSLSSCAYLYFVNPWICIQIRKQKKMMKKKTDDKKWKLHFKSRTNHIVNNGVAHPSYQLKKIVAPINSNCEWSRNKSKNKIRKYADVSATNVDRNLKFEICLENKNYIQK